MKRRELMRHNMSLCGTGRPNSIVNEAEFIDCSELWIMSGRQNEIRPSRQSGHAICYFILDLILRVPK